VRREVAVFSDGTHCSARPVESRVAGVVYILTPQGDRVSARGYARRHNLIYCGVSEAPDAVTR
jgi:hypothetical protein